MIYVKKYNSFLLFVIMCAIFLSCNPSNVEKDSSTEGESVLIIEEVGVNNKEQNLKVPSESKVINSKYPVELIFGIWTDDIRLPLFRIDSISFSPISSEEEIVYTISNDTIMIYEFHHGIPSSGIIEKVTQDSLVIFWYDTKEYNRYWKWSK